MQSCKVSRFARCVPASSNPVFAHEKRHSPWRFGGDVHARLCTGYLTALPPGSGCHGPVARSSARWDSPRHVRDPLLDRPRERLDAGRRYSRRGSPRASAAPPHSSTDSSRSRPRLLVASLMPSPRSEPSPSLLGARRARAARVPRDRRKRSLQVVRVTMRLLELGVGRMSSALSIRARRGRAGAFAIDLSAGESPSSSTRSTERGVARSPAGRVRRSALPHGATTNGGVIVNPVSRRARGRGADAEVDRQLNRRCAVSRPRITVLALEEAREVAPGRVHASVRRRSRLIGGLAKAVLARDVDEDAHPEGGVVVEASPSWRTPAAGGIAETKRASASRCLDISSGHG